MSDRDVSRSIVYCSGPLFCPEERASMSCIATALEEAGYETFLPQRDGLEPYALPLADGPMARAPGSKKIGALIGRAIFDLDVFQVVERCCALVLNMNGRVPDEGAVAEAGIAFASGKPVVIYKNDARTAFGGHDNSMVTFLSSGATLNDTTKLPGAVKAALAASAPFRAADRDLAPRLRLEIARGRRIWKVLRSLPGGLAREDATERIVEELARTSRGIAE